MKTLLDGVELRSWGPDNTSLVKGVCTSGIMEIVLVTHEVEDTLLSPSGMVKIDAKLVNSRFLNFLLVEMDEFEALWCRYVFDRVWLLLKVILTQRT